MNASLPRPGEHVAFVDNGVSAYGICNGEPVALGKYDDEITHVPVHVREGNRNLMVHVKNLRPS